MTVAPHAVLLAVVALIAGGSAVAVAGEPSLEARVDAVGRKFEAELQQKIA